MTPISENRLAASLLATVIVLAAPVRAEMTAFVGVGVVRPETAEILPGRTVVVSGGRITSVATAVQKRSLPPDVRVIDGTGRYLLPGLVEMHAHVPLAEEGEQYLKDILFLWVANGVTTIRGMRGEDAHLVLRSRIASGDLLGPRLITAGPAFIGRSAGTPREAAVEARRQIGAGFDFLKVHMGLGREQYDAIAAAARAAGVPFAGHVAEEVGLGHALAAGQATIDHLDAYMPVMLTGGAAADDVPYGLMGLGLTPYVDPQKLPVVAAATRDAGTWNVPTLSMVENFVRPVSSVSAVDGAQYMPPRTVRGWISAARGFQKTSIADPAVAERFLALRLRLVRALHEAGAGLLLGSDAPQILNVPGFSIHREIELMIEAGMSPAEVLAAATTGPAAFFGRQSQFGRVAAGLAADLVLVDDNPLDRPGTLRRPAGVMLRGLWLSGGEIRRRLDEIERRQAGE